MPKDESIREASRQLCKESMALRETAKISLANAKEALARSQRIREADRNSKIQNALATDLNTTRRRARLTYSPPGIE